MKKLVALLMIVAMVLPWGCSYPDDGNWDALRGGIASMPPLDRSAVRRWHSAHRMFEWCATRIGRLLQPFMTLRCVDEETGAFGQDYTFTLESLRQCMLNGHIVYDNPAYGDYRTFAECVDRFVLATRHAHADANGQDVNNVRCDPEILPGFQDAPVEDWDPGVITDDDIARGLVSSPDLPPAWVWKALGATVVIVGVGVVMVYFPPAGAALGKLAPLLCTLRAEAGQPCPASPFELPGQTPQPPPAGGDQ